MSVRRYLQPQSSVHHKLYRRFLAGLRLAAVVAAILALLAGCEEDDDDNHHEDDYLVTITTTSSLSEIAILRPFDRPFDVVEIGVTPFFGVEPYQLLADGLAWFDGVTIISYDVGGSVQAAFLYPLGGELVIDLFIECDCFVNYVILDSDLGETTLVFN